MRHAVVVKEKGAVQESKFIGFDVNQIRDDFPILHTNVHSKPLIYLDNAATTQKPQLVIDNVTNYYTTYNSNIHRGVHYLSEFATRQFELSRRTIRKFINARYEAEVIFTRGTTESINLVASTFGRKNLKEGDEILITGMEHHSNIVPWQILCEEKKCILRVVPISDSGEIDLNDVERLISKRTKLVSIVHISNSLGTINPVKDVIKIAHDRGIPVLLDAAQSIQHLKIDVQSLDCDFLAFSGHKIYGPTGIGVLYGKKELLESMPPYQGGGDMIMSVSFERTIYNDLPYKFEAGTPNIEAAIGLGEAIRYVESIGLDNIYNHESRLLEYATGLLSSIEGLSIIGTAENKSSVISFVLDGIHPHDVGTLLDAEGIAIRTGHHCTEPVMRRYNVPATSRASFALYNTPEEADALAEAIKKVINMFR
jgi:cysteine desulfurase / selenocysteine lyase